MSHKFIFIANNNIGYGLSGGDTIFIEFIKNWQSTNQIVFLACQEAINILPKTINHIKIITTDSLNPHTGNTVLNLFFHYFRRLHKGFVAVIKNKNQFSDGTFVYTVSDFLPDLLPGLLTKILYPKIKLIAGFYLFAPNPLSPDSPYKGRQSFKGFIYWFIQLFTRPLVNHFADFIFVTSVPDISRFSPSKKIFVVRGGVDLKDIQAYLKINPQKPLIKRKYDACFMGRFHPQKGCLKLIRIWKRVVSLKPDAKLAIIGQGELELPMRKLITKYKLQKNIDMFGFLIGEPKYKIFADSKIVVHPATYDSGGMASAEAMAFGLPGVSFDLESLTTYYPQGFLKSKCFSTADFSRQVFKLLTDKTLYTRLSRESSELVETKWDWAKRSWEIYSFVTYNKS